ncbi:hypothetical protein AN641_03805 [Candidatus Epulonipiscioides gigas]|nr:hypothetical protein AN641_03805 [Epulopiscium sp. SCG-C07WGA-EpuloA2]
MYKPIIEKLINDQKYLFDEVQSGDYSNVKYLPQQIKYVEFDYEDEILTDVNYINRVKIAYYLYFNNIDDEIIIKNLFELEVHWRHRAPFQGVGSVLPLLTHLLLKYNRNNQYEKLFTEAKESNFDCWCGGYVAKHIKIDINDIFTSFTIAVDINAFSEAAELINLWKKTVLCWNIVTYEQLINFNRLANIDDPDPLHALLEISRKTDCSQEIISKWSDVIQCYINLKDYEQAYQEFILMIYNVNIYDVYQINLFNMILYLGLEIINNYKDENYYLWNFLKYYIELKIEVEKKNARAKTYTSDGMWMDLFQKVIKVAYVVEDIVFATQAQLDYTYCQNKCKRAKRQKQ